MARYHDLEYEYEAPPPLLRIRVVHGRSWGAAREFEDELGEPARFGALGQRRAEAVTKALADEMKRQVARIPAASRPRGQFVITVQTLGPTRPMRSNLTADGRALNRRVEVTVGRPGLCPDVT